MKHIHQKFSDILIDEGFAKELTRIGLVEIPSFKEKISLLFNRQKPLSYRLVRVSQQMGPLYEAVLYYLSEQGIFIQEDEEYIRKQTPSKVKNFDTIPTFRYTSIKGKKATLLQNDMYTATYQVRDKNQTRYIIIPRPDLMHELDVHAQFLIDFAHLLDSYQSLSHIRLTKLVHDFLLALPKLLTRQVGIIQKLYTDTVKFDTKKAKRHAITYTLSSSKKKTPILTDIFHQCFKHRIIPTHMYWQRHQNQQIPIVHQVTKTTHISYIEEVILAYLLKHPHHLLQLLCQGQHLSHTQATKIESQISRFFQDTDPENAPITFFTQLVFTHAKNDDLREFARFLDQAERQTHQNIAKSLYDALVQKDLHIQIPKKDTHMKTEKNAQQVEQIHYQTIKEMIEKLETMVIKLTYGILFGALLVSATILLLFRETVLSFYVAIPFFLLAVALSILVFIDGVKRIRN